MSCPTCGADADLIVCGECSACADGEIATWIERLSPEGEG